MSVNFYEKGGAVTSEGLNAVRRFIEGDVLACQTSLVTDLLNQAGGSSVVFDWDDVENLYHLPEHISIAEAEDDEGNTVYQLEDGEAIQSFHDTEEAAREAAKDLEECQEVYEWWLITSWMAEKLKAANQPVLSNGYGHWWGRTTTGQSLFIDAVIVEIAAAHGVVRRAAE